MTAISNETENQLKINMRVIDLTSPEVKVPTRPSAAQIPRPRVNSLIERPLINKKRVLTNRNTDSRFDLTKKRRTASSTKTTLIPKAKTQNHKKGLSRGKKECDRGVNCPYKDEFQHQQEFAHTIEKSPSDRVSLVGGGNRLGGSSSSEFSSGGQKLGRGSTKVNSRPEKEFGSIKHTSSSPPEVGKEEKKIDYVECVHCAFSIALVDYARHLHEHEVGQVATPGGSLLHPDCAMVSNSSRSKPHPSLSLMQQQDEDFRKAELEDLMRLHNPNPNAGISTASCGAGDSPLLPGHVPSPSRKGLASTTETVEVDISLTAQCPTSSVTKILVAGPKILLAFKFNFSSTATAGSYAQPTKVVKPFHTDSSLQVSVWGP